MEWFFFAGAIASVFVTCIGIAFAAYKNSAEYYTKSLWIPVDNADRLSALPSFACFQASKSINLILCVSFFAIAVALAFSFVRLDDGVARLLEVSEFIGDTDSIDSSVVIIEYIYMLLTFSIIIVALFIYADNEKLFVSISDDTKENIGKLFLTVVSTVFLLLSVSTVYILSIVYGDFSVLMRPFFMDSVIIFTDYLTVTSLFLSSFVLPFFLIFIIFTMTVMSLRTILNSFYMKRRNSRITEWDILGPVISRFKSMYWFLTTFSSGFVLSVALTAAASQYGISQGGDAPVTPSTTLIISNAFFDGLTIYTTSILFRWASAAWLRRKGLTYFSKQIESSEISPLHEFERYKHEDTLTRMDSGWRGVKGEEIDYIRAARIVSYPYMSSLPFENEIQADRWLGRRLAGENLSPAAFRAIDKDTPQNRTYRKQMDASTLEAQEKERFSFALGLCLRRTRLGRQIEMAQPRAESIDRAIPEWSALDLKTEYLNYPERNSEEFSRFLTETHDEQFDEKSTRFRPYIAFLVDIAAAALFAIASIHIGLIGSDAVYGLGDSIFLLWDQGALTGETRFGSLFWVMHTTFIPTALVWSILLLIFLAAFVFGPFTSKIASIFGVRRDAEAESTHLALAKTGMGLTLILSALTIFEFIRSS